MGKCNYIRKYDRKYDFIHKCEGSNGLAEVLLDKKWGLINKEGKEITEIKYDGSWDFHNGFAKVFIDYKYGFIDTNGIEVIPCKYLNTEVNKMLEIYISKKKFEDILT